MAFQCHYSLAGWSQAQAMGVGWTWKLCLISTSKSVPYHGLKSRFGRWYETHLNKEQIWELIMICVTSETFLVAVLLQGYPGPLSTVVLHYYKISVNVYISSILILPLYFLKRKFIWGCNSLYICLLLIGLIQVQATLLCPTRNWHWQTLADMH